MKLNLTKTTALAAALLTAGTLNAQTNDVKTFAPEASYRTWSIGVNGGLLNQSNLIGLRRPFNQVEQNFGYGAYIKKQILPELGLQLDYVGGKVAGVRESNGSSFETSTPWSAALAANVTLANINWRHREGVIKPYATAGIGAIGFESTYTAANGTSTVNDRVTQAFIPVGLGLKFGVAPGTNIDLGYKLNLVQSAEFDGHTGNGQKDLFSYAHVGLEFALGDKSKPFLANSNPVNTLYDELLAQKTEIEGQNARLAAGLASQTEENEKLKGQIERLYADLADDDNDGVPNRYDKCPDTPEGTKVDGSGCPLVQPAPVIQQITVTEEDRRVVDEAIKNLEFDTGKSTIRAKSHASLDRVAVLLIEKNFSLKLAGHTDNTGSLQTNLRLSKARAESVKAYLVGKGANPSRIEATGYGPHQPIAPNNTEAGRQQNRRVEFTLY